MSTGNGAAEGSLAGTEMEALRLLALEAAADVDEADRRLISAAAPVLGAVFRHMLVHDIQSPDWPDRDRFIISPSLQPLACALLHLLGRETATTSSSANGATSADDVAAQPAPGKGTCNPARRGLDLPLDLPGHGLAAAVGVALATRLLRARFGPEIFDHATYVLMEDRDVEPGLAQESIAVAPWLAPHRLVALHLTAVHADGSPHGRQRCPNHLARFAAAGWQVQQVRADDADSLAQVLRQISEEQQNAGEQQRPAYVAVEYLADISVPETASLRGRLGWNDLSPGEIPGQVRDFWRLAGLRGRKAHKSWQKRVDGLETSAQACLARWLEQPMPEDFRQHMRALRNKLAEQPVDHDLQALLPSLLAMSRKELPEMVVLAALHGTLPTAEQLPQPDDAATTPSASDTPSPTPDSSGCLPDESGLMDLGLRPMAVVALLTGMAAHGGLRPVGVVHRHQMAQMLPMLAEAAQADMNFTLFVLDDEVCRHAPLEALPDAVHCLCPADAVELVECWQMCMQQPEGASLIFLPEGPRPAVRTAPEKINFCALGGYELFSPQGSPQAVLYAAGRAVAPALEAARLLEKQGVATRIISLPAPHRLARQDEQHLHRIIGPEETHFLVPPGRISAIWSLVMQDGEIIPACADDGAPLDDAALATRIRQKVLAALGEGRLRDDAPANGTTNGDNGAEA